MTYTIYSEHTGSEKGVQTQSPAFLSHGYMIAFGVRVLLYAFEWFLCMLNFMEKWDWILLPVQLNPVFLLYHEPEGVVLALSFILCCHIGLELAYLYSRSTTWIFLDLLSDIMQ